jgi:hypothetical protein
LPTLSTIDDVGLSRSAAVAAPESPLEPLVPEPPIVAISPGDAVFDDADATVVGRRIVGRLELMRMARRAIGRIQSIEATPAS